MVRQATTPIIAENSLAEMEQLIQVKLEAAPSGMTRRDLQWATNAHRKRIEIFERAIKSLSREGLIHGHQEGRSTIYWLAPPEDAEDVISSVIADGDDNLDQAKCKYIQ
jgi:hypothetical protein